MSVFDFTHIETGINQSNKKIDDLSKDITRNSNDFVEWMMEMKKMIEDAPKVTMIERIDKMIADILGKDYSPIIDVKVDNTEMLQQIQSGNDQLIVLLTEIKTQLMKKPTGFEFERDSQGFIKSPIKITYGSR